MFLVLVDSRLGGGILNKIAQVSIVKNKHSYRIDRHPCQQGLGSKERNHSGA